MKNQKISYIVTIYNKENAIAKTIDSLTKQQGDFSKEIICVDDGSTDDSLKIIEDFANKKFKNTEIKVITQKNSGPSIAFNKGLQIATGEYLSLIDGDDYIYPEMSDILLSLIKKYNLGLARAYHSNNPKLEKRIFSNNYELIKQPLERALNNLPLGASCNIMQTSLIKQLGGCDERVFVQDSSLMLRICQNSSIVILDKILAEHIHSDDIRTSNNKLVENRDVAKSRAFFIIDNLENLDLKILNLALKIQLKKTFSWARKQGLLKAVFSKYCYRFILSRFFKISSKQQIKKYMLESLKVF